MLRARRSAGQAPGRSGSGARPRPARSPIRAAARQGPRPRTPWPIRCPPSCGGRTSGPRRSRPRIVPAWSSGPRHAPARTATRGCSRDVLAAELAIQHRPAGDHDRGQVHARRSLSMARVVLSQPDRSTTASSGFAGRTSSTSIAITFRNNIAVGRISDSPGDIVGNSSGNPPACPTPLDGLGDTAQVRVVRRRLRPAVRDPEPVSGLGGWPTGSRLGYADTGLLGLIRRHPERTNEDALGELPGRSWGCKGSQRPGQSPGRTAAPGKPASGSTASSADRRECYD